jgi:hypothetical protein
VGHISHMEKMEVLNYFIQKTEGRGAHGSVVG